MSLSMLTFHRARKYFNQPQEIDGHRFASKKEAKRYADLKLLERAGRIRFLMIHPKYSIAVNNRKICVYEADFSYLDEKGNMVVEDTKGYKTDVYQLKKKLMWAVLGIEVQEP